MPFSLIFSDEAAADLERLEKGIATRIIAKLEGALENPAHFFERLGGREDYKLRVGDYRAIAKINFAEKNIFVIAAGHRKNVYKKLH